MSHLHDAIKWVFSHERECAELAGAALAIAKLTHWGMAHRTALTMLTRVIEVTNNTHAKAGARAAERSLSRPGRRAFHAAIRRVSVNSKPPRQPKGPTL